MSSDSFIRDPLTGPEGRWVVKDSGKREHFSGGGQRDTEDGKIDYTLIFDGPMLKRWAAHLTKGAKKYEPRNWMLFDSEIELERAKRSLVRHLVQYLDGEVDEDHAAAIYFNVNVMEYVKGRLGGTHRPVVGEG